MNSNVRFVLLSLLTAAVTFGVALKIGNAYVFFAGYVVLQYIVLATAWNILGGFTGYVNFGTAAFFALGAYTTVALHKTMPLLPLPAMMLVGGMISGLVGLGMGYLTLRLRGTFFSIATLAMAVVAQTLITNWNFVGGSRGAYIIRPAASPVFTGDYIQYLFAVMLLLSVISVCIARSIQHSKLGYGFAAIRDDEIAAEATGGTDPAAEADCDSGIWRIDGHGGRAIAVLRHLPRSCIGVQPQLRREHDRHAADRRHCDLAGSCHRRSAAWNIAAGRDGDHFLGPVAAAGGRAAGGVRDRGAKGDRRLVPPLSGS